MWALAQIEMKKQLQDKALLFWTLLLPIAFIVLFVSIFSKNMPDKAYLATQIVPGFSVFFSVFIIITIVQSFLKDRDQGMVARLASTPLKLVSYFIGKWIPHVAIVVAQIIILTFIGIVIYDMPLEQPLYFATISITLAVMVTAWGVAVAIFSKTINTGMVVTQIIAMGGAIFAGLWIPYKSLPETIQIIGKFFPQFWAHQGLMHAMSNQMEGLKLLLIILILICYTLAGFVLAFVGYRRFLRTARS